MKAGSGEPGPRWTDETRLATETMPPQPGAPEDRRFQRVHEATRDGLAISGARDLLARRSGMILRQMNQQRTVRPRARQRLVIRK